MKVIIKTLTGKSIEITPIENEWTSDAKEQIENREGIPPDQQLLIFDSQNLENEYTLN